MWLPQQLYNELCVAAGRRASAMDEQEADASDEGRYLIVELRDGLRYTVRLVLVKPTLNNNNNNNNKNLLW